MKNLDARISQVLNETTFDLEYDRITGTGYSKRESRQGIPASEFAAACPNGDAGISRIAASIRVPNAPLAELTGELRVVMGPFIDPDSDRLGHAFPIDHSQQGRSVTTIQENGLAVTARESLVQDFARALVQCAAVIGAERATRLLEGWLDGEPVKFRTSTIADGLIVEGRIAPHVDIEIVPLPLSTAELPRLPLSDRLPPQDYLGLTILSLACSADPALYRPPREGSRAPVRARAAYAKDFNVVCDALSLQADQHISHTLHWTDFEEAAPFSLRDRSTWRQGGGPPAQARLKRLSIDAATETVTIEREAGVQAASLDETKLLRTIESLQRADPNLRTAIERWKRAKRPTARLEDRYIDLRIALEMLYLKNVGDKYRGELQFRLSLYGAWHLGRTLNERRTIRDALRDAYQEGSAAVHFGVIKKPDDAKLAKAQGYCRDAILKLLLEGPPDSWDDLILGVSP